jgi:phosphoribosylformylglycinamidine synthase
MAFAGCVGLSIELAPVPYDGPAQYRRDEVLLFSESNSRFLVEVRPKDAQAFEAETAGLPTARIGRLDDAEQFIVRALDGHEVVRAQLSELKAAWQSPLFPGHEG